MNESVDFVRDLGLPEALAGSVPVNRARTVAEGVFHPLVASDDVREREVPPARPHNDM